MLWGSAFPFIKLGYRLFAIDSADTASILCFAGVRFMIGAALVWLAGLALNRRPLPMPHGKTLASACGLGLWQTAAQYFFYYSAVALLTGAMGGILNSTQSFMGVILAHFLYGKADRMTPRKALGCALGFGGVLVATLGNHGGGSPRALPYADRFGDFCTGRAVEQGRDPAGGQLLGLCAEPRCRRYWRWLSWALLWAAACTRRAAAVSRCCFSWRLSPVRGM